MLSFIYNALFLFQVLLAAAVCSKNGKGLYLYLFKYSLVRHTLPYSEKFDINIF